MGFGNNSYGGGGGSSFGNRSGGGGGGSGGGGFGGNSNNNNNNNNGNNGYGNNTNNSNNSNNQGGSDSSPPDHECGSGPGDTISNIAFTPDNCAMNLVGASSWDKTVRVWNYQLDSSSGQIQTEAFGMQEHHAPVLDVSFSRDGRVFYGGCCKTVVQWNLADGATGQVAGHDLPVSSVNFVEDNVPSAMLITTSWDGKVHFWDTQNSAPVRTEDFGLGPVLACDVKQSAPMATFLFGRGMVVYNLQNMSVHEKMPVNNFIKHGNRCVSNFANCSAMVVGSAEGRLAVHAIDQNASWLQTCFKCHMDEKTTQKGTFVGYQTNVVRSHPTGGTVFSGGSDGYVRIWDIGKKLRIHQTAPKTFNNNPLPITCGNFNPSGSVFGYGVGYDWSLGKDQYNSNAPIALMLKPVAPKYIFEAAGNN